jgi:hypothetical protein
MSRVLDLMPTANCLKARQFVPAILAGAWMLSWAARRVSAQDNTPVAGTVFESTTGLPVPNVEVRILGTSRMAHTDSAGGFKFSLEPGRYLIRATRLGFGPRSVPLDIGSGDTVTVGIEMAILPVMLAEVVVKAREEKYRGKMAGFAERMRTSPAPRSAFITRDEIERANPTRLSDLFRSRGGRAGCASSATVYLDGVQVSPDKIGAPLRGVRSEPLQRDFRLDHFPPDEIEAIEFYVGGAQTPAQFSATARQGLSAGCTILIWTR